MPVAFPPLGATVANVVADPVAVAVAVDVAVQNPPSQAAVEVVVTAQTKSACISIVFRPRSTPVGHGSNLISDKEVGSPPKTVEIGASSSPTAVVVASTVSVAVRDLMLVMVVVGSSPPCVVTLPVTLPITETMAELAEEMAEDADETSPPIIAVAVEIGESFEAVIVLVMLGIEVIVEAVTVLASCVLVASVSSLRRELWIELTWEEADAVSIGRAVSVSSADEGATVAVTETVSVTTPPSCPCRSVGVAVAVTWTVDVSSPLGTTTTGTVLVTTPLEDWTTATVSVLTPLATTTTAAVEVSMPSVTVSVSGGTYGAIVYAVTLSVTVVTPDVTVMVVTPLFS